MRWIADNDEPECMDPEEVGYQISSLLLADLFGFEPEKVGADVVKQREIAKQVREEEADMGRKLRAAAARGEL